MGKETQKHEEEYFHVSKDAIRIFLGVVVLISFIYAGLYFFVLTEVVKTTEKVIVDRNSYIVNYDSNREIVCEDGVVISDYGYTKKIYSCLAGIDYKTNKCLGEGKVCLIVSSERKWR